MRNRFTFASLVILLLTTMLSLLLVTTLPTVANAGQEGKSKSPGQEKKEARDQESGEPDGDADSDDSTADEDSHEAEDESVDDNQHPSGKDRSAEYGGSGNQGSAESNPDDSKGPMRFECDRAADELGDDKPGGPGGCDAEDQDGNNGCGNDDDFDDDNNGWCGPRAKTVTTDVEPDDVCVENCAPCSTTNCPPPVKKCPDGSPMPESGVCDIVKGEIIENGKADVTITVDCFSITVTSTKDISNVKVTFADGSFQEFNGLSGYEWSMTFTKAVSSATAKSSTTEVAGTAPTTCGTTTTTGGEKCPDGSIMPTSGVCPTTTTTTGGEKCPDGSPMPENGKCDTETTCPDGSEMPENGKCETTTKTTCPDDQMPNEEGNCVTVVTTCPGGEMPDKHGKCDTVKGDQTCPDGSMPSSTGTCTTTVVTCPGGSVPMVEGCQSPDANPTVTCDAGQMPFEGQCVPIECPEGEMPSVTTGTCVEVSDDECPAGMVAGDGGTCVPAVVESDNTIPCPTTAIMAESEGGCPEDDSVLGGTITPDDDQVLGAGAPGGGDTAPDTTAAGRAETSPAAGGAVLPLTGAGIFLALIAGLALIGAGITAIRRGKTSN